MASSRVLLARACSFLVLTTFFGQHGHAEVEVAVEAVAEVEVEAVAEVEVEVEVETLEVASTLGVVETLEVEVVGGEVEVAVGVGGEVARLGATVRVVVARRRG